MYFTSGSDRAFEQLMQGKPGFDHYDSGEAVTPEDCGTCRFYRPHWKYQFCVYAECPYQPGKLTAYDAVTFRVKGVENMAVFRVERNKGYTVMSNHHLRNKDLSLKAKGLLSQMLSLPEDWDYTLKGLSLINREQIDAIRAAIRELEQAGYIVRSRERDSQGRLRGADYVIYEQPQPVPDSPTLENPMLDNPTQEKPTLGKPTQLNKDISSKEKSITEPMPFTQWENPYFTVDPPAQEQGDIFAIYQIKGGPETRDYRFEAYESLQEAGLAVDRQNYDLVYTAPLDGKTTLEDIYRTFNLDRPADFTGHSLSVSDIVVLTRSGKEEAHYCDSFGFTPVPEFFLQREKQLTPRELLTGESIQTPRGSFLVTDMSREQLEAAGYGFHHQSEDGKYLMRKSRISTRMKSLSLQTMRMTRLKPKKRRNRFDLSDCGKTECWSRHREGSGRNLP